MIDFNKPIKTRGGLGVKVFMTDGGGARPIIGAIKRSYGWDPTSWLADGRFFLDGKESNLDLVNVPTKFRREGWVNVYYPSGMFPSGIGSFCSSKYEADRIGDTRIACVKVVVEGEEGEGL